MKYILLPLAILLLASCTSDQQKDKTTSTGDNTRIITRTDTVYVVRNVIITPANAYSDLFLDSGAVEDFIQQKKISGDDAERFRSFYNYRNLQFAWFSSDGLTEQARGFWNLQDMYGTSKPEKTFGNRMDTLLEQQAFTFNRFDTSYANTELSLTQAYLQFYKTHRDKLPFSDLAPEKTIPVKKEPELIMAEKLLQQRSDTAKTMGTPYMLLKQKLVLYTAAAKQGGWLPLTNNVKRLKKGVSSADVILLKKRLQLTGDYITTDTGRRFNDTLEMAIKSYQSRYSMKPTGLITDSLIKSLNVPVGERLRQILINIDRMQWIAVQTGNHIWVNIPDFMLTVYENRSKAFDMPVVVGKEATSTTVFSDNLDQIVFSPYWNVPPSIVKGEILPAMKADPGYLKKKNMEIVNKNDTLPVIRQLPGGDNSLGKVKFLFPNRYDIYLHDTRATELFKRDNRMVSHGCIRVAEAEKLANYLLRNNNTWTPVKINTAMNSGKEQFVKLTSPVPVAITYFTAWVDDKDQLNFSDDVYGHDKKITRMLFAKAPPPPPPAKDTSGVKKKEATVVKKK